MANVNHSLSHTKAMFNTIGSSRGNFLNYSVAYDRNNRKPLYYESYPGSIVDSFRFQYTIEKTRSYGYRHLGFILDRGYFSRENIHFH